MDKKIYLMKLGVVVVVYKTDLKKNSVIESILLEMRKNTSLELLVFENSSRKNQEDLIINKEGYYLYQQTGNLGTSGAYSFAIDFFKSLNCNYIALFDQDSIINSNYFKQLNKCLSLNSFSVAVPKVISKNRQISPTYFNPLWGPTLKNNSFFQGNSFVTAISSGSIHSIDLIASFQPFPKELWLDYFDHWLFLKYNNSNVKIDLIDFEISHDLSIQNLSSISSFRLKNIYSSEKYFFFNHLGRLSLFTYYIKITLRLVKILTTTPSQFQRCFKFLFL